jgi:hypothetical protein
MGDGVEVIVGAGNRPLAAAPEPKKRRPG